MLSLVLSDDVGTSKMPQRQIKDVEQFALPPRSKKAPSSIFQKSKRTIRQLNAAALDGLHFLEYHFLSVLT